jgi:mannitol/fructose-specific phosphotransferase system IIA component (Ntr-type)
MNWNNLEQSSIILHLDSTEKEAAIHELLTRAPAFKDVRDFQALEKGILSREKVMSTGLGRGVAISHGEVPEIGKVAIALGLSEKGINFDSIDGYPVHILFVVVNSKLKRGEYLEVLSSLIKLMRDGEVRDGIRCCSCSSEVEKLLHVASAAG